MVATTMGGSGNAVSNVTVKLPVSVLATVKPLPATGWPFALTLPG
jgi:hypothetical protein